MPALRRPASAALLGLGLTSGAATANALRPPRAARLALPSFVWGWPVSELPVHQLVAQAVAARALVRLGALRRPAGRAGMAALVASWVGLVVLAWRGHRAAEVVDRALADLVPRGGDGPPHRRRRLRWAQLALPLPMRDRRVEKVAGIPFAPGRRRGRPLRLDVYRRRDHPVGRPVLLYVHGGAWVLGDKREQGVPMLLELAARGWVCVTANYRLSPRATFPDHLVDVKRALAWVRAHVAEFGGDPGVVVISGGSAGGHLAALAALTPNDPRYQPGFEDRDTSVAACVPFYGVYDLTNRHGVYHADTGRLLARLVMKVSLEEDREAWERASPMSQVGPDAPPFLVVHGANDTLVPVSEARHFVELLRSCSGAPVAYVELPGAQHAFELLPSPRTAHVVAGVAEFLDAVVAPSAQAAADSAARRA